MSKTWRRHAGWKDRGHDARTAAAREFRRKGPELEVSNGCEYKRHFPQWDICDWNCTQSIEQERYEYHHPLTNWGCMCDPYPHRRRSWTRGVEVPAPDPVITEMTWTLPEGHHFMLRWGVGTQRVNPETGDYEVEGVWEEWRWYGSKGSRILPDVVVEEFVGDDDDNIALVAYTPHDMYRRGKAEWRKVAVRGWIHNDNPRVEKWVEAPYFTEKDVRIHVEKREAQTRNYRAKLNFPRYGRRDRRTARNMKRSSGVPGGLF